MARRILLDTDVLVDFLRGYKSAVAFVTENADWILLSSVSVAELYAGARDEAEESTLAQLISLFRVVDVSPEIARAGGILRRDYAKPHGVGLADALLAATAASEKADLATLNTRHYPMIQGLRPAYPKAGK